jgi:carbamoyltransferase
MNEYMQYTAKAKHDYSSVTHVDGTARVQLVKPDCESVLRPILEEYYELTGVPMLLNTSLNIRNRPMVNTIEDAEEWERKYNVKVF